MATENETAMHVTETKTLYSTLNIIKSKSEEISKEKEEELLYGNNEDGDEEALSDDQSDDSIRLRISGSEDETKVPASEDVNKITKQSEPTIMELESDVSATDNSELKTALSDQNLSNGKCSVETEEIRANQEEQLSKNDFDANLKPNTDTPCGVSNKFVNCNGIIPQSGTESFDLQESGRIASNLIGSHFNLGERNSVSRQTYFQPDRYTERYYNQHSHYGGGKGYNRGNSPYHKESENRDANCEKKSVPDAISSDTLKNTDTEKSEMTPTPETTKMEDPENSSSRSDNTVPIKIEPQVGESSQICETPQQCDETNEILEDENTKVACVNITDLDSKESVEQSHENDITDSNPDDPDKVDTPADITDVGSITDINDASDDNGCNTQMQMKSDEVESKELDEKMEKVDLITENITDNVESEKSDEPMDVAIPVVTSNQQPLEKEDVNTEMEDTIMDESMDESFKESGEATEIEASKDTGKTESKESEESEANQCEPLETSKLECSDVKSQVSDTSTNESDNASKDPPDESQSKKDASLVIKNDSETVERVVTALNNDNLSEPTIKDIEATIAEFPDEDDSSLNNDDDSNNVTHCSLKRTSKEVLDDMDLSKRIRIRRKSCTDSIEHSSSKSVENASKIEKDAITDSPEIKSDSVNGHSNDTAAIKNVVEKPNCPKPDQQEIAKSESVDNESNIEKNDDCEVIEVPVKRRRKRSKRTLNAVRDAIVYAENTQDNVRQKRQTARNAEEIIRKELLGNSGSESSDSASKYVAVNYNKMKTNNLRATSPPTETSDCSSVPSNKRYLADADKKQDGLVAKKIKQDVAVNGGVSKSEVVRDLKKQTLRHVRKFFQRDSTGKLAKLKQEELEELLIQKIVETLTMRDEMGKLREQAKISERNQEATRHRCQQLAKQIKDMEMVLHRFQIDRKSNPEKSVVPIKINRSVGLQVNFVSETGHIQNLRQLGQAQKSSGPISNGTPCSPQQVEKSPIVTPSTTPNTTPTLPVIKRTVKTRSPRRPEGPGAVPVISSGPATSVQNQPLVSTITPTALVMAKSVPDTRPSVTTTVQQANVSQLLSPNQAILLNGATNQQIRPSTTHHMSKTNVLKNNDLIDLTQEEDRTKTPVANKPTILTTPISEPSTNSPNLQKIAPRYHTVIQPIPNTSGAMSGQTGIRVVQPASQPTPTALVNNMNAPRVAYVMQGGTGQPRQVVITSTPAPIRPAPTNLRTSFPLTGTISNGTVRVIPATPATIQIYKHPAALPESQNSPSNPAWKLPPPAPSLKISKVPNGIVLSWNMALSDKFAEIASYQLYAYQEVSGVAPNSTLWKKVGDVRALPLPMACTLTQFSEGNNYYFAVRAVDKHSRLGQYSQPGHISL